MRQHWNLEVGLFNLHGPRINFNEPAARRRAFAVLQLARSAGQEGGGQEGRQWGGAGPHSGPRYYSTTTLDIGLQVLLSTRI